MTVSLSAHNVLEIEPQNVTFAPADWATAQAVTIHAIDDRIAFGEQTITIMHDISSQDSNYATLLAESLVARVEDNDAPDIVVAAAGTVQVSESGATGTYSIFLRSQPAEPLHIAFVTDSQIRVKPASITINESNWRTSHIVTVSAIDDDLSEGIHSSSIRHNASSADLAYDGYVIDSVPVLISDNDSPDVYAVAGMVFEDANQNAELDDSEELISDVHITLVDTATGGQAYSKSVTTDAQGNYRVNSVPAGQFTIRLFPPVGYRSTPQHEIPITISGEDVLVPAFPISRNTDNIYLPIISRPQRAE